MPSYQDFLSMWSDALNKRVEQIGPKGFDPSLQYGTLGRRVSSDELRRRRRDRVFDKTRPEFRWATGSGYPRLEVGLVDFDVEAVTARVVKQYEAMQSPGVPSKAETRKPLKSEKPTVPTTPLDAIGALTKGKAITADPEPEPQFDAGRQDRPTFGGFRISPTVAEHLTSALRADKDTVDEVIRRIDGDAKLETRQKEVLRTVADDARGGGFIRHHDPKDAKQIMANWLFKQLGEPVGSKASDDDEGTTRTDGKSIAPRGKEFKVNQRASTSSERGKGASGSSSNDANTRNETEHSSGRAEAGGQSAQLAQYDKSRQSQIEWEDLPIETYSRGHRSVTTNGPVLIEISTFTAGVDGMVYTVDWHPLDQSGDRLEVVRSAESRLQEFGGHILPGLPSKRVFKPPFDHPHGFKVTVNIPPQASVNANSAGNWLRIFLPRLSKIY